MKTSSYSRNGRYKPQRPGRYIVERMLRDSGAHALGGRQSSTADPEKPGPLVAVHFSSDGLTVIRSA